MPGNLFRHYGVLAEKATGAPSAATFTGTTYQLIPKADEVADVDQIFQMVFENTISAFDAGDSVTPKLQTSWDNVNWVDVVSGTGLVANGTSAEFKALPVTAVLGTYVRVVVTHVGAINWAGVCRLVSNGRFTLKAV